jgi:hypothetical protein
MGRTRALLLAEMLQTTILLLLILYKGLIRSVLENGCIAFDRMAATHMLKLERIQYR